VVIISAAMRPVLHMVPGNADRIVGTLAEDLPTPFSSGTGENHRIEGSLKNCHFAQSRRCTIKFYPLNIMYMPAVKFSCAPRA
jgi:hypothetical protein